MKQLVEFLAQHGYWALFVSVLCRQACLPVPANLLLVAAGALAGSGKLNLAVILVFSMAAFLVADLAWYLAGRHWGGRTLEFVCGASRDPSACVEKMSSRFSRHGVRLLLVSKFIIGVDAVAAPMSGLSRIGIAKFLLFDAVGAFLWSGVYAALGYVFSNQLDRVAAYTTAAGRLLLLLGIASVAGVMVLRLFRWYRFLRKFRLARITPDELQEKLSSGTGMLVLDLQGGLRHGQDLGGIPGAVRVNPHLLAQYMKQYRTVDLRTEREVVLYCTSLQELTSARVALALQQRGFEHVRPLAGGLEAWRNRGFTVTTEVAMLPAPEHAVFLLREVLQYSCTSSARFLSTSTAEIEHLLEHAMNRISRKPFGDRASSSE